MNDGDQELLARLSLEEKVSLLSGKDHWSLPAPGDVARFPVRARAPD